MTMRPLEAPLSTLVSIDTPKRALEKIDLELVCDSGGMKLISEDDLFGYDTDKDGEYYKDLYTICCTASGGGFHIWYFPSATEKDTKSIADYAVVYLGSEGERAKVGQNVTEFLQVACSLVPHYMDAITDLPGINTLPDNGDIQNATTADFDVKKTATKIEEWLLSSVGDDDVMAEQQSAQQILQAIGRPKLTVEQALEKLIGAHLAEPRFAIQPEDEDD